MRRRLVVRPEARQDIEEAALRYEIQRQELAGRFLKELAELFERILSNPLQFPEISQEIRRGLLRRFPYAVYFFPVHETIVVIAVLHQHRYPDTWKQRL